MKAKPLGECVRKAGSFLAASVLSLATAQQICAQTAPVATTVTYEVRGSILNAIRQPLGLVEVILVRDAAVVHTVVSTDDGRFTFGRLTGGPVTLHFRRLGFAAQTIDLVVGPGGHPAVREIVLLEVPSQLDEITISSEAASDRYRGFHERRQQRGSFARFLEHNEIRGLGPANASDLFRTVPGIRVQSAANGNTIRIRGCQPMVVVDGQRVPGAELDEMIQPSEIGAIEFYPSFAGIPAQFVERGNRLCGLILVWTR